MVELFFTIPGKPQGKDRPRGYVKTLSVNRELAGYNPKIKAKRCIAMKTTKKTADYEFLIATLAKQQMKGRGLFSCPIKVSITLFYPIAKSWTRTKQDHARTAKMAPSIKPDIDNCIKVIFDALNKVIWIDDVLVVECHVYKRFSDEPRVEVHVMTIDNLLTV